MLTGLLPVQKFLQEVLSNSCELTNFNTVEALKYMTPSGANYLINVVFWRFLEGKFTKNYLQRPPIFRITTPSQINFSTMHTVTLILFLEKNI